jgi:hypothetical protein
MAFFLSRLCPGKERGAECAGDSNSHSSPAIQNWTNVLMNFLTYNELYCHFLLKQPV